MRWRKRLTASMPGMTGAVVEGARDPRGGAEERGRASSRENSPQAHMADLKHPYAGAKQKICESVDALSLSLPLPFEILCTSWSVLFCIQLRIPLTIAEAWQGCFRSSTLGIQCHGQCVDGAVKYRLL